MDHLAIRRFLPLRAIICNNYCNQTGQMTTWNDKTAGRDHAHTRTNHTAQLVANESIRGVLHVTHYYDLPRHPHFAHAIIP